MIVTIIYRVHGRRVKLMRANGAPVVWVQAVIEFVSELNIPERAESWAALPSAQYPGSGPLGAILIIHTSQHHNRHLAVLQHSASKSAIFNLVKMSRKVRCSSIKHQPHHHGIVLVTCYLTYHRFTGNRQYMTFRHTFHYLQSFHP